VKTFKVTIIRTIETTITVEAPSSASAKRQIREYGIEEAWADYPADDQKDSCRIRSAVEIKRD